MRINWKSLGAAGVTALGLLAQNAGLFGKAAPWLTLAGLLAQSLTHPVVQQSE